MSNVPRSASREMGVRRAYVPSLTWTFRLDDISVRAVQEAKPHELTLGQLLLGSYFH